MAALSLRVLCGWVLLAGLAHAAPVPPAADAPAPDRPARAEPRPPARRLVPTDGQLRLTLGQPPARETSGETSPEVQERLAFLIGSLDRGRSHYRAWWIAWITTYAALTVGQGVAVAIVGEVIQGRRERLASQRAYAIGAGASALGVIFAGVGYSGAIHGSASVAAERDGSAEGDVRALARAEALVRSAAAKQRFGRSWLVHVGGAAVNVGIALVLWLVLEKPLNAGIQIGVGIAVSQTQIWTQPMQAARDWEAYRQRFPQAAAARVAFDPPRLALVPHPGGLGLRVVW